GSHAPKVKAIRNSRNQFDLPVGIILLLIIFIVFVNAYFL
ncbi:MAG: hypothetical protein ACI8VT_003620, partial [Saprospiraceae bacterium]